MCRNIKTLFNFEPPVTDDEIRASALQFARKLSGFNQPSKANQAAFLLAIEAVTAASRNLLRSLETSAPPQESSGGSGQGAGPRGTAVRRMKSAAACAALKF